MALPYQLRLLGLCLAVFFLVHFAAGLLVNGLGRRLARRAAGMAPRGAAGLLFTWRLLPPALGVFAVLGLCLPSYLRLEPSRESERVGLLFLLAASLGLAVWLAGAVRALVAALDTRRYRRHCERHGREAQWPGATSRLLLVEDRGPLLFLTGLFHPRLVASRGLLGALSAAQLDVVLRHERAHAESHDNLKRLLLLLAPGLLPGWNGFGDLDRAWMCAAEWAADDRAVDGDSRRSLSLAGALIRVARLGAVPPQAPLAHALLASPRDLAPRVQRLLAPPRPVGRRERRSTLFLQGVLALAAAGVVAVLFLPGSLYAVHTALEILIH